MTTIPTANYALIGGSGTWGARFPEDLELPNVELTDYFESFDTPYGSTAPFKLLSIAGQPVWRTAMHGMWDHGGGPGRPTSHPLAGCQTGGLGTGTGRRPVGHGGGFGWRHPKAGQARRAIAPLEHHHKHRLHDVLPAGG